MRAILDLEAAPGFEPGNRGFADRCLTTWLCRHKKNDSDADERRFSGFYQDKKGYLTFLRQQKWSGKRDLNPRLQPWQGCTLPLSYSRSMY